MILLLLTSARGGWLPTRVSDHFDDLPGCPPRGVERPRPAEGEHLEKLAGLAHSVAQRAVSCTHFFAASLGFSRRARPARSDRRCGQDERAEVRPRVVEADG